ncbi:lipid-A-disaccharide synthase [Legionella sp. km772]|uniref:lipid-A-disaccharide synthase n=1 Tax=Legionella sp. km772 TaxID=2498111 RepID=UPI000F8D68F0|nr:lipid-A-disaccharide synthase [Legionella sp. km772]RUR10270.1 lipid-A-disaccharide synthase [Legionella sp. km772]
MPKAKHVVIVAGEESGDLHAAKLIQQLKLKHADIQISGIGGKHMSEAGAELLADLATYGVTGATEVLRYFKIIRQAFHAIKAHLKNNPPDLLILVDYPGFNLRLAKYAKEELNLKIVYYISPQIWAWKAKRIHLIKKCVDHMAVILPFEKDIYQQAGVPVDFVGHPLVEKMTNTNNPEFYREHLKLPPGKRIIALLPGSRMNEIVRHMPILRDTAHHLQQFDPDIHFVIPIARTINRDKIHAYFSNSTLNISFINDQAVECMSAADFVIVASGTASLECALLERPMCIIYKSSLLTYIIAMKLIKVRFLGLCNLLAKKMIVPEFLQYDCNPIELSKYIINFYADSEQRQHMLRELFTLKEKMSAKKSDCTLESIVNAKLTEINT